MSTYLQLCQNTARECGVAQGGTYPTAVTSQVGILNKITYWVKDSWLEIQGRPVDWRWMRVGFTLDTTASDGVYAYGDVTDILTTAAIARFSRWRVNDPDDPAKCFLTSSGVGTQYWLSYLDWDYFKAIYRIGTQTEGPPAHISVDPQNNLVLGPVPDAIYTITGDYQRGFQELAADGDTPDMPAQWQNLIVYEAMMKYGMDQASPEITTRGLNYSNKTMRQLEANQGELMTMPVPLA